MPDHPKTAAVARLCASAAPVAALGGAILIAVGSTLWLAPASGSAAEHCWERVLDDWADNSRVDGAYSVVCLQEALGRVPEDIRVYSTFEEQVQQARHLAAVPHAAGQPSTFSDKPPEAGSGTTDARSIPLPLLVLAALALTLIGAGAAALAGRRLRARRTIRGLS